MFTPNRNTGISWSISLFFLYHNLSYPHPVNPSEPLVYPVDSQLMISLNKFYESLPKRTHNNDRDTHKHKTSLLNLELLMQVTKHKHNKKAKSLKLPSHNNSSYKYKRFEFKSWRTNRSFSNEKQQQLYHTVKHIILKMPNVKNVKLLRISKLDTTIVSIKLRAREVTHLRRFQYWLQINHLP